MEPLTKVYSALQSELKGLSEDHKSLKSTLSGRVSNDIESLKTAILSSLEQKKFQLLADITTSEKLNQDAGKIQKCADRLATDFAKLSSNPASSLDAIQAFQQQVLEVKSVVEALNADKFKGLAYEKVLRDINASIGSLSLGFSDSKVVRPTKPKASDDDNRRWLLTASRTTSDTHKPETSPSVSNPVGDHETEDLSFWLRPATTLKSVEKEWCDATSQWFKFASTMEWLNPRGTTPSSSASTTSSAKLAAAKPETNPRAESVVTSWMNFANSVEWYKPRDAPTAEVKTDEPSVAGAKKSHEAPPTSNSTKTAGGYFTAWAATASTHTWLATTSQKAATLPTSARAPSTCIWLAGNSREAPPKQQDVFSGWSKAAAEVSWVTKKAGTSSPDPKYASVSWLPDPSLNWVIEDKRPAPPTPSKDATPPQPAVKETSNMSMWLPKGSVQAQRSEDKTFSSPSYNSDSIWLISDRPQSLPASSVNSDTIIDWLLPSPTSGLNDDDSQDFEIVEESLIS